MTSSDIGARTPGRRVRTWGPGLLVMAAAVTFALLLANLQTVLGALVISLALGILLGNSGLYTPLLRAGIAGGTKRFLRTGVVLLGLQLALPDILALGPGLILLIVT